MTLEAVVLAILIGAVMGLLGGGGSILAVPAFTFMLGLPPKQAVVISLVVVGFASAVGAMQALIRGVVSPALVLVVGGSASAGAVGGSLIGTRINDQLQLHILAVVMLTAAVVMMRQPRAASTVDRASPLALAAIGGATGVLTGIVGVGGGFLIVPALVAATGMTMQSAAAASMSVIALAAMSALPGYVASVSLDWPFIMSLAVIAGMATVAGARLARGIPQRVLQRAFALSLVILGSWVWVRA